MSKLTRARQIVALINEILLMLLFAIGAILGAKMVIEALR